MKLAWSRSAQISHGGSTSDDDVNLEESCFPSASSYEAIGIVVGHETMPQVRVYVEDGSWD